MQHVVAAMVGKRFCLYPAGDGPKLRYGDHIVPHRGNATLFWDVENWQSLCTAHHSETKQGLEQRGYDNRVGTDGWPTDQNHPSHNKDLTNLPSPGPGEKKTHGSKDTRKE